MTEHRLSSSTLDTTRFSTQKQNMNNEPLTPNTVYPIELKSHSAREWLARGILVGAVRIAHLKRVGCHLK